MSKIAVKGIIDEDFVNYKLPCMTIMFPKCSFKCGKDLCQNSELAKMENICVSIEGLVSRYLNNPITKAICFQGLEPFDSPEVFNLIKRFREETDDPIVIYTGYTREEARENGWTDWLGDYRYIIVKYGRYIPGGKPHFDEVLGVNLASENQYAVEERHGKVEMGKSIL